MSLGGSLLGGLLGGLLDGLGGGLLGYLLGVDFLGCNFSYRERLESVDRWRFAADILDDGNQSRTFPAR